MQADRRFPLRSIVRQIMSSAARHGGHYPNEILANEYQIEAWRGEIWWADHMVGREHRVPDIASRVAILGVPVVERDGPVRLCYWEAFNPEEPGEELRRAS